MLCPQAASRESVNVQSLARTAKEVRESPVRCEHNTRRMYSLTSEISRYVLRKSGRRAGRLTIATVLWASANWRDCWSEPSRGCLIYREQPAAVPYLDQTGARAIETNCLSSTGLRFQRQDSKIRSKLPPKTAALYAAYAHVLLAPSLVPTLWRRRCICVLPFIPLSRV